MRMCFTVRDLLAAVVFYLYTKISLMYFYYFFKQRNPLLRHFNAFGAKDDARNELDGSELGPIIRNVSFFFCFSKYIVCSASVW